MFFIPRLVFRKKKKEKSHSSLDLEELTPCKNGAKEERNSRVETDKHAAPNKRRREFQEPTPVLDGQSGTVVARPDVEPTEDVPIEEKTGEVRGKNTETDGDGERYGQSAGLSLGVYTSVSSDRVH